MRYLSDSTRSIAFYDASGAGLARGVTIVAVWLVGAVLVGAGCAWLLDRRSAPQASTGSARVSPLKPKTA
jgi:F0F1-type ATP synthase assembly protein I